MTKHDNKQSFIAGFLEAQPEWREAGRTIREHERRVRAYEVTPDYVKSLEPILGKGFAVECDYYLWYDVYDSIGETLHLWEQELLAEKGFVKQAESAWAEFRRDSAASA